MLEKILDFVFQHTNPSLIASTLIIYHLFSLRCHSFTAALLNRFNCINWCHVISVWTYWFLEEEHRQSSNEGHIAQQRLHHHSQHAVDLWKHRRDTLTYTHTYKENLHPAGP